MAEEDTYTGSEIAIIGMACRFPGAETPEQYWRNLCDGVESLTELTDAELREAGVPDEQIRNPAFVRRASVVDGIEEFDASFFGYTPLEATIMDPQHRLFLECAWEVFEKGGYDPQGSTSPVGVFTGAKTNTYLFNVVAQRQRFPALDNFQIALGNDLMAMATRVSFKLDLRGPSYAIHTACSTSLVAVHLACQSLLLDECTMAVAGGSAVNFPQRTGYMHHTGGILSPDGSTRTFDQDSAGSSFGNGCGAVLLKRLDDAIRDRDHIYAVVRGSATNNDGAAKASFTAPGVEGQTAVLLEAMAVAGIDAEDISYIEAHGTATELGDSIEILALKNAFGASTQRRQFCTLGSVKTNMGHLETAAGIAGLMKTAMALEHRQIPPSLHFEKPNPNLELDDSPFVVGRTLQEWPEVDGKRRIAGISSFGIGSTNAHVVLEEPPAPPATTPSRPWQLLLLSARSPEALEAQGQGLGRYLEEHPERELPDVAFTLQTGRHDFEHRRAVVCRDLEGAREALAQADDARAATGHVAESSRGVAFLFPGLGEHHTDMGLGLYQGEAVFRRELDRCAELLREPLGLDLRQELYPRGTDAEETKQGGGPDLKRMLGRASAAGVEPTRFDETWLAQPVLFAVEYALAKLWQSWGLEPKAMAGYSLGEYVAACLAGVLSLEDALRVVAHRARLIHTVETGAMVAVPLSEDDLAPLLETHGLCLAAVNGPTATVAAGPLPAVEAFETDLDSQEIVYRRLTTTHAFHSKMLEALADDLTAFVKGLTLSPPAIPYVSNVTGTWITDEQATDPGYWARHMCGAVRFGDAIETLLGESNRTFLEVGPGLSLTSAMKQHPACDAGTARRTVTSMSGTFDRRADAEALLGALGRLWLHGNTIDWQGFYGDEARRRVPLSTYPFQRQRHWLDVDMETAEAGRSSVASRVTLDKVDDLGHWFYRPEWTPRSLPEAQTDDGSAGCLLIFDDAAGVGSQLAEVRRRAGQTVVTVAAGPAFAETGDGAYTLDPRDPAGYSELLAALGRQDRIPTQVAHLWGLGGDTTEDSSAHQDRGFYSLLFLAQALGRIHRPAPVNILVGTSGVHRVSGDEPLCADKATVIGPVRVIPQEVAGLFCRAVDLVAGQEPEALAAVLDQELAADAQPDADEDIGQIVAWRGEERLVQDFVPNPLDAADGESPLRQGGVYLLTGGLGGLGLVIAEHLATSAGARLVLTGRSPLPERDAWDAWLEEHPEDDPVSFKIRSVRGLEAQGAEVLALAADAADADAMAAVVAAANERFGAIHGVIHMAGVPGGGILQLKNRDAAERILAPKVEGARILDGLFRDADLDFLMVFSSIASVLGEFGQIDYCGANAYLDAYAWNAAAQGGPPVITVDWDIWREVGLALHAEVPEHLRPWREEMLEKAILSREGIEAFDRILASGLTQVVVSTQDLPGRIELGKSFTGENFLAHLGLAGEAESGATDAAQATPSATATATPGLALGGASLERRLAEIWQRILGIEKVGVNDNFFDLGGNSLVGLQVVAEIGRELGVEIPPVTLFESPTVSALARQLAPQSEETQGPVLRSGDDSHDIALVAMTGRFPGANTIEDMWENLRNGVESITFLEEDELIAAGVDPELVRDPGYVKAVSAIDDVDLFDAQLFGYSPREAEVMDPQHRLFLECAWEVLEKAGFDSTRYPGSIGVFAGCNLSTYLLKLYADPRARASVNMLQAILGNDKDSLTTTLSYKLDLRGPSVAVQTFCSTSLVAVHMACQSLRQGECDMALAGGVRVVVPDRVGYLYEEGGIAPPDGHSRSFDAGANGSVLGQGVGIVALMRRADAEAEGAPILAVLKGSAINNDGSLKAGYTAPSVAGQSKAVVKAIEDAGVSPESIGYVEAHGSATELGDPIEVTALTSAWRRFTDQKNFCAIGSVKSNFGHLDRAAGVAGLIKTVLTLRHGEIPATVHFTEPNPQIDFANSPFVVADALREWPRNGAPRRAAVNSLGMGGTNVHVIVEEAPERPASDPGQPWQLLLLSARTETALAAAAGDLAEHLEHGSGVDLADVAYTGQVGRRHLGWRRTVVCRDTEDAVAVLRGEDPRRALTTWCEDGEREVVFLFSGLGGQYPGMTRGLYETETVFRQEVDRAAEHLETFLGLDLREVIYPEEQTAAESSSKMDLKAMLGRGGERSEAAQRLNETWLTQPAIFVVEYALARLWMSWGVEPRAMMGYSLGEYVAATLAGVLTFEDALELVAKRAKMIHSLSAGSMLAVALPEQEILERLPEELSLAALNGAEQSVVSGPVDAVAAFAESLSAQDIAHRPVETSHAFHSSMMEPLADELTALAAGFERRAPSIAWVSNVTGTWITDDEATDPAYWARHMCQPVRFADGLAELLDDDTRIFLELGPGQTLTSLVHHHAAEAKLGERVAIGAVRHSYERQDDRAVLLTALGKLWLAGARVHWPATHGDARRLRVELPTYPFERRRYWIDTEGEVIVGGHRSAQAAAEAHGDEDDGGTTYYPRPTLRVEYVAPRNDEERAVAAVWSELLGVEQIGIYDNFLELGGDSLLASRLVTRLRDVLGADLPIRLLFEAPTVAELVEAAKDHRPEAEVAGAADDGEDMEAMLEMVKGLEGEDLEAELARMEREMMEAPQSATE